MCVTCSTRLPVKHTFIRTADLFYNICLPYFDAGLMADLLKLVLVLVTPGNGIKQFLIHVSSFQNIYGISDSHDQFCLIKDVFLALWLSFIWQQYVLKLAKTLNFKPVFQSLHMLWQFMAKWKKRCAAIHQIQWMEPHQSVNQWLCEKKSLKCVFWEPQCLRSEKIDTLKIL